MLLYIHSKGTIKEETEIKENNVKVAAEQKSI